MPSDPKKNIVDGRRRAITIHDGTRLTPTLVRILEVLSDEANEILDAGFDQEQNARGARAKSSTYKLEEVDPILVSRADGIAVYVPRDGRLL